MKAGRAGSTAAALGMCAAAVALSLLVASPVPAHTQILETRPEQGAELRSPPGRVEIVLEGPVEAEFSPLEVYDERGERVDEDNARAAPGASNTLVVDLPQGLAAGLYTVAYRYTGTDGHVIEGVYEFALETGAVGGDREAPRPAAPVSAASSREPPEAGDREVGRAGAFPWRGSYLAAGALALASGVLLALRRR